MAGKKLIVVLGMLLAAVSFSAAAAEDPFRSVRVSFGQKRYEKALEELRPLLEKNPGGPKELQWLGKLLEVLRRPSDAARAYRKAYRTLGGLPKLDKEDKKLLNELSHALKRTDRLGEMVRAVDHKNMLSLAEFATKMRRRGITDLYNAVRKLCFAVDPGDPRVRNIVERERKDKLRAERRRREEEMRRMNMGFGVGGGTRTPSWRRRGAAAERAGSTLATDSEFDMEFENQAMVRWLTQMFSFLPNRVPVVEGGLMSSHSRITMTHHAAKLSADRQLRILLAAGSGLIRLGNQTHPDMLQLVSLAEAGSSNGGRTRFAKYDDDTVELILQNMDGRIAGFVNDTPVCSASADPSWEQRGLTITLLPGARVLSIHLEAATVITAAAAEQDAVGEEDLAAERQERKERAQGLLATAKQLVTRGKYKEARDMLSEARSLDPESIEIACLLGKARERTKQPRSAIHAYTHVLRLAAKTPNLDDALKALVSSAELGIKKLDSDGRELKRKIDKYISELEAVRKKVSRDAAALKQLNARLEMLKAFREDPLRPFKTERDAALPKTGGIEKSPEGIISGPVGAAL